MRTGEVGPCENPLKTYQDGKIAEEKHREILFIYFFFDVIHTCTLVAGSIDRDGISVFAF